MALVREREDLVRAVLGYVSGTAFGRPDDPNYDANLEYHEDMLNEAVEKLFHALHPDEEAGTKQEEATSSDIAYSEIIQQQAETIQGLFKSIDDLTKERQEMRDTLVAVANGLVSTGEGIFRLIHNGEET